VKGVEEIVIREEPEAPALRATLTGVNEIERPIAEAGTVPESDTLPASPVLPRVSAAVAELPATKLAGVTGPVDKEKSASTIIVILVWPVKDPLLPVTRIV